jgi:hypothetical protein
LVRSWLDNRVAAIPDLKRKRSPQGATSISRSSLAALNAASQ